MIIDAMDLLYSNTVDAYALMTSDSDFTPLVMRILSKKGPDTFSSNVSGPNGTYLSFLG